ncbi:MAG: PIG-L deacetylase family protein [Acidimicrobiales bacterium]
MTKKSKDLETPATALAIAAHPDDIEFQCGATFAKWAGEGCIIHHLICTDGSKGTWDPTADTVELVARRQREQLEAARRLGATGEVRYLGEVDGELQQSPELVSAIARHIRELRPNVVLGHDPWKRWRLHPDHRNAGFLTTDAVVAARDPHFYPEHQVPHHRPAQLLLFETDEPNHSEDVSGFEAAKVFALEAHESQFETTMDITDLDDTHQREEFRMSIKAELADAGATVGMASAELFRRIDP